MAAETVISGVVEQLTGLLFKQAEKQIDLLRGVEDKVENLAHSFEKIEAVLADAEQRKHEEKAVQLWLHHLEDVSYEIDDVLDEWNYFILKKQIEGSSHGNDDASIAKQRSIIDHGALQCLLPLLINNQSSYIENENCNMIANIIWMNNNIVQAVIQVGFVAPLVDRCKVPGDTCIHAAKAITQLIWGVSHEQIKFFESEGYVMLVSRLLDEFQREFGWLKVMKNILKVGEDITQQNHEELEENVNLFKQVIEENGGLQSILRLKSHESDFVRENVAEILRKYWPEVADKEENEENGGLQSILRLKSHDSEFVRENVV